MSTAATVQLENESCALKFPSMFMTGKKILRDTTPSSSSKVTLALD